MQELPGARTNYRARVRQRASFKLGFAPDFAASRGGASSMSRLATGEVSSAPDGFARWRARRSDSVVGRKPKRRQVAPTSVLAAGIYLKRESRSRIAAALMPDESGEARSNRYASPTIGAGGSAGASGGAGGGSFTGLPG
jgi:hypothetical protein